MRKIGFVLAALAVLWIMPGVVRAESPFTGDELARCIQDTPEFLKYMEKQGASYDSEDPSALEQLAEQQAAMSWLKAKGWDPERYSYVLEHMSKGYMAQKLRQEMPEGNEQMQQAMNMPGMTPEMQAQMAEAMGQINEAREAKDIPASEMSLIEANMGKINSMYEGME